MNSSSSGRGPRPVGQVEILGKPGVVGGGPGRIGPLEIGAVVVPNGSSTGSPAKRCRNQVRPPWSCGAPARAGTGRRRHGPLGERLTGQASATVQQRGPVPVQDRLQQMALRAGLRPSRPLHVGGFPCHAAYPATPSSRFSRSGSASTSIATILRCRREPEHRDQPAVRELSTPRPVDQRGPRGHTGPGEQLRPAGDLVCAPDQRRGAGRRGGAEVGPQDDIRIQQFHQRAEVPGSRGGQERVDDLPLAARVGVRLDAPDRTRRRARLASILAASGVRPTIGPISVNGTPNRSCSTNASRSAGFSVSSTTSSASPTASAVSASCSGSLSSSPLMTGSAGVPPATPPAGPCASGACPGRSGR